MHDLVEGGGGDPLLEIDGLTIEFRIGGRWTAVAEDVSLSVGRGRIVGLVGESGSGKTVVSMAILGLIGEVGGRVTARSVRFDGVDITGDQRRVRALRGREIGMIFQQPRRSLDPAFTVGDQIAEAVRTHRRCRRREAMARAVEMLERVGIPDPARRAREYPHQFSGGMCQRVMIAMALACEPRLLIADEPTTALDVTVQKSILDLLREVQRTTGISVLFISHDLGVIAEHCDDVVVMYAGQVVERAPVDDLFGTPTHPYTEGLLGSIPELGPSDRLIALPGSVPAPGTLVDTCRFLPRCAHAEEARCDQPIAPVSRGAGRDVRCVRAGELTLKGVLETWPS